MNVRTYDLSKKFQDSKSTPSTQSKANDFLLKQLIDIDSSKNTYTLWKANNTKYYTVKSDGNNLNVLSTIPNVPENGELICGDIYLCYDTINSVFYKGTGL